MRFVRIAAAVTGVGLLLGGSVLPSIADTPRDRNILAQTRGAGLLLAASQAPVISIYSPSDGDRFTGSEAKIIYDVGSAPGTPVDRIDVLVDGRPVATRRGLERTDEPPQQPGMTAGQVTVPLPNKDVTVSLIAHAGEQVSAPATVKLVWGGPGIDRLKPKLYAVVVGVSHYADTSLALRYAAKDANDFAGALQGQTGGLYADVQAKVLTDGEATRRNIVNALEWLKSEVTSNAVGVVYVAGHGWTNKAGDFWFLPVDAAPDDLADMVAKDDILRPMNALAGKALLFIDACHAAAAPGKVGAHQSIARGSVDMNSVLSDFASAGPGIVTFASSKGREVSLERDDWGNGAFTKALVEALAQGKAAAGGTDAITLSALNHYVVERVKALTGGIQHPVMNQNNVPDFPIAMARADADTADVAGAAGAGVAASQPSMEAIFWQSIANSSRKEDFQAYLDQFPRGVFAALARMRIATLEAAAKPAEPVTPAAPKTEIAKLPQPASAGASVEEAKPSRDLIRNIRKELVRVGCLTGSANDVWEEKGKGAVESFARYAKLELASLEPSEDLLSTLKAQDSRVCPLICGARFDARGNACVLKTCPKGTILSGNGSCSARPSPPPAPSLGAKKSAPASASASGCRRETVAACRGRVQGSSSSSSRADRLDDDNPMYCDLPANRLCLK